MRRMAPWWGRGEMSVEGRREMTRRRAQGLALVLLLLLLQQERSPRREPAPPTPQLSSSGWFGLPLQTVESASPLQARQASLTADPTLTT